MPLCERCRERLNASHVPLSNNEKECEVCGGILDKTDIFFQLFKEETGSIEFTTFLIGLRTKQELVVREESLQKPENSQFKSVKQEFQYILGRKIELELGLTVDFRNPQVVFTINQETLDYDLWIKPLYVAGRYRKLKRGIPQTPWIKPGRGKGNDKSISEYIGEMAVHALKGKDYDFFASGREDVDALMLGTGRPFYVEIHRPTRRSLDSDEMRDEIFHISEGAVELTDLRIVERPEIEVLKRARYDKTYEVGITIDGEIPQDLEKKVESFSGIVLMQRTPNRVLPIRKDMLRKRLIKSAGVKSIEGNKIIIAITTVAGTYIKEFVTGDNDRTVPNLRKELGVNVKIDYLNVLEVT